MFLKKLKEEVLLHIIDLILKDQPNCRFETLMSLSKDNSLFSVVAKQTNLKSLKYPSKIYEILHRKMELSEQLFFKEIDKQIVKTMKDKVFELLESFGHS